jgi:hypothetical protein
VTPLSDIEHAFCQADHISKVYGIPQINAQTLVDQILAANNGPFLVEFANKRANLKSTAIREYQDAASATDLVGNQIAFWQVRGKSLFPLILAEIKKLDHNPMHLAAKESEALVDPGLKAFVDAMKASAAPVTEAVPSLVAAQVTAPVIPGTQAA